MLESGETIAWQHKATIGRDLLAHYSLRMALLMDPEAVSAALEAGNQLGPFYSPSTQTEKDQFENMMAAQNIDR